MNQYFKKTLGIFLVITGLMLSTPIFGSGYYGGSESEKILLDGEVVFGGIGENWDSNLGEFEQTTPIVMIKYQGDLYRCHVTVDIDGGENIPQQDDGFEVHCWGRKK